MLIEILSSVTVEENEQVVAYALAKRPNVRLVETNLTFGREGFTSYRGKTFPPSLKLTRRYYPHTYNVDGFFVAKFQKVAATPANAVLVDRTDSGRSASSRKTDSEDSEVVDKAPITDDEGKDGDEDDDFGGFDDAADQEIIEKGKRNAMRRRGLDPHALNKNKNDGKSENEASKVEKAKVKNAKKGKVEKPRTEENSKAEKPKVEKSTKDEKSTAKSKTKKKAASK